MNISSNIWHNNSLLSYVTIKTCTAIVNTYQVFSSVTFLKGYNAIFFESSLSLFGNFGSAPRSNTISGKNVKKEDKMKRFEPS